MTTYSSTRPTTFSTIRLSEKGAKVLISTDVPAVIRGNYPSISPSDRAVVALPSHMNVFMEDFQFRLAIRDKLVYLWTQAQTERTYTSPPPNVFPARMAASMLGVSTQQLHAWSRKGWLKCWKVEGRSGFSRTEVQAMMLSQDPMWWESDVAKDYVRQYACKQKKLRLRISLQQKQRESTPKSTSAPFRLAVSPAVGTQFHASVSDDIYDLPF
ncbi:MerR family transcriptional regulator [Hymenobacter negativus]|uniref:DNA-binding protein n=1 Tax=Hymenobacter negativus TaxID=2795026 RepID=A0ABS0Q601_9BACT|nr:hypothetical protein [Hymenobacter negativus]MBH8557922.1 hypothetical protein [Hymenobacter negativus]